MKVKNHKDFACFKYESGTAKNVQLGDVLIKTVHKDFPDEKPEIGVVIQIHSGTNYSNCDDEYRTDMWGNGCLGHSPLYGTERLATLEEIEKYRPELLKDLKK